MIGIYEDVSSASRSVLLKRFRHLEETIALIERNLASGKVYPPDEPEIKESREVFLKEREKISALLSRTA